MNDLFWVLAANAVVWLGLGAYLFRLRRIKAQLEKRLLRLEKEMPDTAIFSTAGSLPRRERP